MINSYIVKATRENKKWISGIFDDEQKLNNYINEILRELKTYQEIIRIEDLLYPFYIIENSGFTYLTKEQLIENLNSIEHKDNEDIVYFNIYTIRSDYQPKKPGTNYMGIIEHDHINNDFLDWFKKEGEEFLIRRRILLG